jgi:uncharacterized Fe-S cluster protein YjdI
MSKKTYTNGEVTVTWEPAKCIHSEKCFKGLPEVFKPSEKPWIKMEGSTTDEIVNQVKICPSGALNYYFNDAPIEEVKESSEPEKEIPLVEIIANGPIMVYGDIKVDFQDAKKRRKGKVTAFCRCGASKKKPHCDGSHKKVGFKG